MPVFKTYTNDVETYLKHKQQDYGFLFLNFRA